MRKNCAQTINAWLDRRPYGKRGDSIWTDGDGIYSYSTWVVCMAERRVWEYSGRPMFLFNATKYSQTTTTHQNAIRAYMEEHGFNMRVYDNVLRGTPYQS